MLFVTFSPVMHQHQLKKVKLSGLFIFLAFMSPVICVSCCPVSVQILDYIYIYFFFLYFACSLLYQLSQHMDLMFYILLRLCNIVFRQPLCFCQHSVVGFPISKCGLSSISQLIIPCDNTIFDSLSQKDIMKTSLTIVDAPRASVKFYP